MKSKARKVDHLANIGANLKELRKSRGLTLAELAKRTSISTGMVSFVERGLSVPS